MPGQLVSFMVSFGKNYRSGSRKLFRMLTKDNQSTAFFVLILPVTDESPTASTCFLLFKKLLSRGTTHYTKANNLQYNVSIQSNGLGYGIRHPLRTRRRIRGCGA